MNSASSVPTTEARKGPGRPASAEPTAPTSISITSDQRAKLKDLGGSSWLREQIEGAEKAQTATEGAQEVSRKRGKRSDSLDLIPTNFRISQEQKDKVKANGGGKWLRKTIDLSTVPPIKAVHPIKSLTPEQALKLKELGGAEWILAKMEEDCDHD